MPEIQIADIFQDAFSSARYKLYYGGRGGGKSWAIARSLILLSVQKPIRVLCCREFQTSIKQSVYQLLSEQIELMGFSDFFDIQEKIIIGKNGTDFIFQGLARNINGIKSTENISIAWVEEAQTISKPSLELLIPTVRAPNSEIWFSWNPQQDDAPIETLKKALESSEQVKSVIQKVGWQDNPWFTKELNEERLLCLETDPEAYDHIWEGGFQTISEAVIFKDRVAIKVFETPGKARLFYGVDWGFSVDPTAMVRCFIEDNCLYIDYEAYKVGVELDHLPDFFDRHIPECRKWPIGADCARPETISYIKRQNFRIYPAKKWPGSVEDGIEFLKGFKKIIIHPRCVNTAKEFRLYSYKVDRITRDILPKIEDKNNHAIDALRYALDKMITAKGLPKMPTMLRI